MEKTFNEMIKQALLRGASGAVLISPKDILVEEELALLCQTPGCENYGLSASCPPHVAGPGGFRDLVEESNHALVVKIDVPMEILLSHERRDIMRLLHEIVSHAEDSAVQMGFTGSKAFAGGSCKKIFCVDHIECRLLSSDGTCRHPQSARASMSGFGINVSRLMLSAGWRLNAGSPEDDPEAESIGTVCGLVLIGE